MPTRKAKRKISLLLAVIMVASLFGAIATDSSAGQIEMHDDAPLYHVVNNSGESTGSDTDAEVSSPLGKVRISKTIEGTDEENVFDITLEVNTKQMVQTVVTSPDAAAVLVIDASGSMGRCSECGKELSHNDHKGPNPECSGTVSRLTVAKSAAINFAKSFVSDSGGAKRYIALVTFATGAKTEQNWIDAAELDWSGSNPDNALTQAINSITAANYTNIEGGLQLAHNLMQSPYSDAYLAGVDDANKFVILLSDGTPNRIISGSDRTKTDGFNGFNATTPNAANAAAAVAANITGTLGLKLYSVCYGASNEYIRSGETVADWLTDISTRSFSANNSEQLNQSFESIIDQIRLITQAWTVIDPMGEFIIFDFPYNSETHQIATDSATNIRNFDTVSNSLYWKLSGEIPLVTGEGDDEFLYTYTLTYRVKLDTAAEGFTEELEGEDVFHLTNKRTTLSYAFYNEDGKLLDEEGILIYNENGTINDNSDGVTTLRTIDFKVPRVKGKIPIVDYAIEFYKKDRDGVYHQVTADKIMGTAKMWSIIHAPDGYAAKYSDDIFNFDHGDTSKQLTALTGNVLRLYYDPITTTATVNHFYKEDITEADGTFIPGTYPTLPQNSITVTPLYLGDTFTAEKIPNGHNFDTATTNSPGGFLSGTYTITLDEDSANNIINYYYTKSTDRRPQYEFTVIYKNGYTGTQLGTATGTSALGTVMNHSEVAKSLGDDWLNALRPSGYSSGVATYITITEDPEANIIYVVYNYSPPYNPPTSPPTTPTPPTEPPIDIDDPDVPLDPEPPIDIPDEELPKAGGLGIASVAILGASTLLAGLVLRRKNKDGEKGSK